MNEFSKALSCSRRWRSSCREATLNISWDPEQIGMTAGEVGVALLKGEPRIMTQAEGEGHSFVIRPVAMKSGEHKIVAARLFEVFNAAPKPTPPKAWEAPAADISGPWEAEMQFEVGSSRHKLLLVANGNSLVGLHQGLLPGAGYNNQFEGGWEILHPGKKLVGRAVTVQYMPLRPDVVDVADANAIAKGQDLFRT